MFGQTLAIVRNTFREAVRDLLKKFPPKD